MANNTMLYEENWTAKVQERLNEPNKFKEICRVEYTNQRLLHNPYLTNPTVQTGSRGTAYTFQAIVENDDNVTFSTYQNLPQRIDRADLAQSTFLSQMELADRQGVLLNEAIETAVYGIAASSLTNFDNASIGGSAGSITVSLQNVLSIITGVKREIRKAGGESLFQQNGGYMVWKPAELEILEQFCASNGYAFADEVLSNGIVQGHRAIGMTHYSSNLLPACRMQAGVKKVFHVGILKDTYGDVQFLYEDPGSVSGVGIVSRIDYGIKVWNNVKPILFDIPVSTV